MIGVRTFIAISICDEIKKRFIEIIAELEKAKADVRWAKPQTMHITLKFLGYIEIGQLESIFAMTSQSAREINRFTLSFSSDKGGTFLSGFPNLFRPRILWVGVNKGKEEIIKLATLIDENLKRLCFEPEKKEFTPHVTLGRVKSSQGINEIVKLISTIDTSFYEEMEVTNLDIIGSQLTKNGPVYTVLKQLELGK